MIWEWIQGRHRLVQHAHRSYPSLVEIILLSCTISEICIESGKFFSHDATYGDPVLVRLH